MDNKYQRFIKPGQEQISPEVDLIIGLPQVNGNQDLSGLVSLLEAGLEIYFPELTALIACIISPTSSQASKEAMESYKPRSKDRILLLYSESENPDRGVMVRELIDLAFNFSADLVFFDPAFFASNGNVPGENLTPDWVEVLYQPIQEGNAKLVLPRFKFSGPVNNSIGEHFFFPLMVSLFNLEFKGFVGAGMSISRQLLGDLKEGLSGLKEEFSEYGIDYWIIMFGLKLKAQMAEIYLGIQQEDIPPIDFKYILGQVVPTVFEFIGQSQEVWKKNPQGVISPLVFGPREHLFLEGISLDSRAYRNSFFRGYSRYYDAVWSRIFPEELSTQIREAATSSDENFSFSPTLWARLVYESLISYHFNPNLEKEDLARSLIPLFEGRVAGYLNELPLRSPCEKEEKIPQQTACPIMARKILLTQNDIYMSWRPAFFEKWIPHEEALQPFLPEISYWEYIPGVPIVLPHVVNSNSGERAHVSGIYEQLLKEYKEEFNSFSNEVLNLSPRDGYKKLGERVRGKMERIEESLNRFLLPGEMHLLEQVREMGDCVFRLYPYPQSLSLKEEVADQLMRENPPRNLITRWGCRDTEELLEKHNSLDVLALTSLSEAARYNALNAEWLKNNLKPEHFEISPIRPLVVDYREFPAMLSMKDAPSLNHLTSRVLINNLRKGGGGHFPKLRFLTVVLKNIIEAEQFGKAWEAFKKGDRKFFGEKVINSIEGHWGSGMFSGHSIFENHQHRILKEKILQISQKEWAQKGGAVEDAKQLLEQMASVYHLGLTLPDNHFITYSLWSWASYSSKGGRGFPSPMSLMIERHWFSSELFFRCYEQLGGNREEVRAKIEELMGQGEEQKDLASIFLGAPPDRKEVLIYQKGKKDSLPAGKLVRSPFNPILSPITKHNWESKYVLNCGAIWVGGKINIFYRAVGDDGISRVGLALSEDGLQIDERLPDPVFGPGDESEKMGCEDPRLISIEGRVYMLYTAYDGVTPQIALASIAEEDLLRRRWNEWRRHGLVFPGFPNKDAVLFPERFEGNLAMYHRIAPSIWIAFSQTFDTPWPREGHKIIMGSRSGMMWDAIKIGAGAQPIKTRYGWLLIYHGVDYRMRYSLGVFITALEDPSRVIYRSPNPILEPEKPYELGTSGHSWVPNVVFTCGAVAAKEKEILGAEDEILIYYGGADTVIGVAQARIGDLIPREVRGEK